MTITILGKNATINLTIDAPTTLQSFSSYFINLINNNELTSTPQVLSISLPTTATGINLTSFGRTDSTIDEFDGSVWRLRNGTNEDVNGTLIGFNTEFSNTYELAAHTDTFVISPIFNGAATHLLRVDEMTKTKAASSNLFDASNSIDGDNYKIMGGIGDDSLTGADLNDTLNGNDGDDTLRGGRVRDTLQGGAGDDRLFGQGGIDFLDGEDGDDRLFGGGFGDTLQGGNGRDILSGQDQNDILTGGADGDTFRFTNQGRDEVTDFSLEDQDILQIRSDVYINAPIGDTTPIIGAAGDSGVNIYVDISTNIDSIDSSSVHFAYATDTNQLLYDLDGDWNNNNDRIIVADTNEFGTPTAANFDFL